MERFVFFAPYLQNYFEYFRTTLVVPGGFSRFLETSQIAGPNIFLSLKRLFGARCVRTGTRDNKYYYYRYLDGTDVSAMDQKVNVPT